MDGSVEPEVKGKASNLKHAVQEAEPYRVMEARQARPGVVSRLSQVCKKFDKEESSKKNALALDGEATPESVGHCTCTGLLGSSSLTLPVELDCILPSTQFCQLALPWRSQQKQSNQMKCEKDRQV